MQSASRLDGIHHVTAITGDARRNLDFYTGVLGLRLVAKSVNQDEAGFYHLFYGDERGTPGSLITFFEYPGAVPGRAGAGMVHRLVWRVESRDALDFWSARLSAHALPRVEREPDRLLFSDPEGLGHELTVSAGPDAPLVASHPEVTAKLALQGLLGVRAYAADPELGRGLLEGILGARPLAPAEWELRGDRRGGTIAYDAAPAARGHRSAGTVHHVAWATSREEQPLWDERLRAARVPTSGVIDRHFFRAIYFREPSGVLFEVADDAPGFAAGGDVEQLGSGLALPPWLEPRRHEISAVLTPLPDPRSQLTTTIDAKEGSND
jgi:glyoxalase family protein